jgi:protein MAK16
MDNISIFVSKYSFLSLDQGSIFGMQSDDVIWQVINDQFCSFKVKAATATFCRNENNVTGICNRISCPLANGQYATIREIDGRIFLLKKTVERAHTPAKLWEKIALSGDKVQGTAKIDAELQYWSPFLLEKCKLRYERMLEIRSRMQKLVAKAKDQPILTTKASKVERRERGRERKARATARLELSIEKELVERLKQGVYGDMYNVHQKAFESVLQSQGQPLELVEEDEGELEEYEFIEGEEDDEEVEYDDVENIELEQELDDIHDIESIELPKKETRKKGPYVEVEYETELTESRLHK